jgi:hypothetical protein
MPVEELQLKLDVLERETERTLTTKTTVPVTSLLRICELLQNLQTEVVILVEEAAQEENLNDD